MGGSSRNLYKFKIMTPTVRYNNRNEREKRVWNYHVFSFTFWSAVGLGLVFGLFNMIGYIYAIITGNV